MGESLSVALRDAEESKMRGMIYRVLGMMEVSADGAVSLESNQLTFRRNSQSIEMVRVSSDQGHDEFLVDTTGGKLELAKPPIDLSPGQWIFEHLKKDGVFRLSYTVTWVINQEQQNNYTIHYFIDDKGYRASIAEFYSFISVILLSIVLSILVTSSFGNRWAVSPINTVNKQLSDLHERKRDKLDVDLVTELNPLLTSLNNVISSERARQTRFKNALSDLAHTLKTPLAILINETDRMPNGPSKQTFSEQLQRLNAIITQQLARAAATGQREIASGTNLAISIERITNALQKLYPHVKLELAIPSNLHITLDEADFMDVFGNLIENAMKYGDDYVRITAVRKASNTPLIFIEDNGPGWPQDAGTVMQRGVRADTKIEGQGLGLPLAKEILTHYKIAMRLACSLEFEGACVVIEAFEPASARA